MSLSTLPISEKIAICDRAIKAKFGQQSGIRRSRAGCWEVVIQYKAESGYEIRGRHRASPFTACKQAGVEVDA